MSSVLDDALDRILDFSGTGFRIDQELDEGLEAFRKRQRDVAAWSVPAQMPAGSFAAKLDALQKARFPRGQTKSAIDPESSAAKRPQAGKAALGGVMAKISVKDVLRPSLGAVDPIEIHREMAGLGKISQDDEEWQRRSSGGGGGGKGNRAFGSPVANRAAAAAGAQSAVVKVISSVHTAGGGANLINYLGTRENEKGGREDIPVFTQDGRALESMEDRAAELAVWTSDFRDAYSTNSVITASVQVDADASDEQVHEALTSVFGAKPFVYARTSETVAIYGISDIDPRKAFRELKNKSQRKLEAGQTDGEGRGVSEKRSGSLLKKEQARIDAAFEEAGVVAKSGITGAVGKAEKARYFLEKFIRTHRDYFAADGRPQRTGNASHDAKEQFQSWKEHIKQRTPINAYHVVFSARKGTNALAMVEATKAFLDDVAQDRKWMIAHHPETGHVHVHAMIAARDAVGKPLRITKPVLHEWRERFAEKAREQGIAMVATRRIEIAAGRRYTQNQSAAVDRSRRERGYKVSARIAERVDRKRAGAIEPIADGNTALAVAKSWSQTATAVQQAAPAVAATAQRTATHLHTINLANEITAIELAVGSQTAGIQSLTKEQIDMALNPKQFQEREARVLESLTAIEKNAPANRKSEVAEIRSSTLAFLDQHRPNAKSAGQVPKPDSSTTGEGTKPASSGTAQQPDTHAKSTPTEIVQLMEKEAAIQKARDARAERSRQEQATKDKDAAKQKAIEAGRQRRQQERDSGNER